MAEIRILPPAAKYIKKIKDKRLKEKFHSTIEQLKENPYIGKTKKGDLAGIYSCDIYYNNTNYELAYRIYEKNGVLVVIIMAGTRENFYEQLKRYNR